MREGNLIMKYCRNCGAIYADSYERYDRESCLGCGFPLKEDPDMSEEKFLQLSENGKDEYELHIIEFCKQSGFFNENDCERGKHYDYYYAFRFDKYEQLSGKKAPIKKELTPDEEAIEKWKTKQYIDKTVSNYVSSNSNPIPKCPICNSTNLSKISSVKKATKIGLFGIFGAGDVGKTWKCNNCGSKF